MTRAVEAHHCTLGDLMEGQVISEVFYCRHGIPLGRPQPQPQLEPVLKSAWSTLAESDDEEVAFQ